MNENTVRQLLARITRLEDQISRIQSRDGVELVSSSWTPELEGSTTAGVFVYGQQAARYIQIENWIWFYGRITISSITTPAAGNLRIIGFPFTPPNSVNNPPVFFQTNLNLTAGYSHVVGNFPANNSRIDVTEAGDDVLQNYNAANLAANDSLRFSGFTFSNI